MAPLPHHALICEGPASFAASVGPFLRRGLDEGGRVMAIVPPERIELLRDEVDPTELATIDPSQHPASITAALIDHVGAGDARWHVVGDWMSGARGPAEIADRLRREAAGDRIFGRFPVSMLCVYDAAVLPDEVIDAARRTHPLLWTSEGPEPSLDHVAAEAFAASGGAVQPPLGAPGLRLEGARDLLDARRLVMTEALGTGIPAERAGDLLVAVVEVLTNALEHGRAPAHLYTYRENGSWVCHVHDSGLGVGDPFVGYVPPAPDAGCGYGMWIARRFADAVEIAGDESGTHVRVIATLG